MSLDDTRSDAQPAAAVTTDLHGSEDDPRIASALAAYLADLQAGRHPSREKLLRSNPEIAEALRDWFDVVEFVQSAAESAYSNPPLSPSEDALPSNTILGEYRLVREIGRGGMGVVYEAQQVSLGRRVALKVLSGNAALDPLKLQRFRIETQAVAQLHHPHIVPIFAVGSERGTHHYAMQYIDGTTLAEVIMHQRRFGGCPPGKPEVWPDSPDSGLMPSSPGAAKAHSELPANGVSGRASESALPGTTVSGTSSLRRRGAFRALARLAIQAAEALAHAHSMGILHRDIKPSNLLVDTRGHLWVTDFGLARFQDEPGLTHTGDLLGTLRYIAPELVQGHRMVHDPRSDIYSLGATFYELLTLRPVFDGHDRQVLLRQIVQDEPIPPRLIDPTIPRDLETIVLKAMDKEPDRRYSTAQALADDLRLYLEDKTIRARRPSAFERAAKWARRHRTVLRTSAAVACVAVAIAAPLLRREQAKTAQTDQDLRLTFHQADVGFEQMMRLSDELTTKGMSRYAEAGRTPEAAAIRTDFFRQAIDFYERLVREPHIAKPMIALAHRRLGFARMMGVQDPHAVDDFRQALTLYEELLAASPGDPALRDAISNVQLNLGMFNLFNRRTSAAQSAFGRVKSIDEGLAADFPDDPANLDRLTDHRIQIATWMETAGKRTEADQECHALLALFEKLPVGPAGKTRDTAASYCRLARAFREVRRPREEQAALRRGLELDPKSPALQNELARALALNPDAPPRDADEAIELAKRATAASPDLGTFWTTLGLAQLRGGHWPPAEEAVKKSMELQPRTCDGSDQLLMAMISFRRGDKQTALDWYMKGIDWMLRASQSDTSVISLRAETERLLGRKQDEGGAFGPPGRP